MCQGRLASGAKWVSIVLPQRTACGPGQPHWQHGQVQPATDISHGDKKMGKSSHCQSLFPVLVAAKEMSSEEQVAHKVLWAAAQGDPTWTQGALGLRRFHCIAGCPAPWERCPWAQCRHSGYKSHRSTGLGKMPKPGAFLKSQHPSKTKKVLP